MAPEDVAQEGFEIELIDISSFNEDCLHGRKNWWWVDSSVRRKQTSANSQPWLLFNIDDYILNLPVGRAEKD